MSMMALKNKNGEQDCDANSTVLDFISRNYNFSENCDFCRPIRCLSCEYRMSMIPSILLLLINNDFIKVVDMGHWRASVKCLSAHLRRFGYGNLVNVASTRMAKHVFVSEERTKLDVQP